MRYSTLTQTAVVSFFLLLTPGLSFASSQNSSEHLKNDPAQLKVPLQAAFVREVYKGTQDKLLIHIQDAHTNLSAQKNLATVLEDLIKRYGVDLVFVEGGTGDDSLSFLREYAPLEDRRRVAMEFLEQGEISGEEYLDIVSDEPFLLWGIEDPELYQDSIRHYSRIIEFQKSANHYLDDLEHKDLHVLKDYFALKFTPAQMQEYQESIHQFRVSAALEWSEVLDQADREIRAFYANMAKRDNAFVERAFQKMEESQRNIAVLISGGYHTDHLKKLLKTKGASYAVVTPFVTEETDLARYEALLLARETISNSPSPKSNLSFKEKYLAPTS